MIDAKGGGHTAHNLRSFLHYPTFSNIRETFTRKTFKQPEKNNPDMKQYCDKLNNSEKKGQDAISHALPLSVTPGAALWAAPCARCKLSGP
jgi:hypothetical protein